MAERHERVRTKELERLGVFSAFEIRQMVDREWFYMARRYKDKWGYVDGRTPSVEELRLKVKIAELEAELDEYKRTYEIQQNTLLNIAYNPFL